MVKILLKITFGSLKLFTSLFKGICSHFVSIGAITCAIFALGYIVAYVFGSAIGFVRSKDRVSFDLVSSTGSAIMSEALKGRKYILFFTKPKCKKCLNQLETLQQFRKDNDILIYAVTPSIARMDNSIINNNATTEGQIYNAFLTGLVENKNKSLFRQAYAFFIILPHLVIVNEQNDIILDITGKITERDKKKMTKVLGKEDGESVDSKHVTVTF